MSVMLYLCIVCVAMLFYLFVCCVFVNCFVKQFIRNMFGCGCYFVVECYG